MNIRTWQELKALSNNQWPDDECMKEEIAQLRAELSQPVSMEPVHQFRKWGCSDWYDGVADHTDGHGPYEERELYTATQLAAARQQGAEEVQVEAGRIVLDTIQKSKQRIAELESEYNAALANWNTNMEIVQKQKQRIAELEKSNAQLLEALKELYEGCIGFMSEDNSDMTKARAAIEAAEVKS